LRHASRVSTILEPQKTEQETGGISIVAERVSTTVKLLVHAMNQTISIGSDKQRKTLLEFATLADRLSKADLLEALAAMLSNKEDGVANCVECYRAPCHPTALYHYLASQRIIIPTESVG
jgi:hypothetical protein